MTLVPTTSAMFCRTVCHGQRRNAAHACLIFPGGSSPGSQTPRVNARKVQPAPPRALRTGRKRLNTYCSTVQPEPYRKLQRTGSKSSAHTHTCRDGKTARFPVTTMARVPPPDLSRPAVLYAFDQLVSSGFPSLSMRLRDAGLHAAVLGVLEERSSDDSLIDALRALRVAEASLQLADSVESMRDVLRAASARVSRCDGGPATTALRSTIRVLGLQHSLLRYCLAGLMSSQIRRLSQTITSTASSVQLPPGAPPSRAQAASTLTDEPTPPALAHFSAADYDWLGFDLDHTLVAYKQVLHSPPGTRFAGLEDCATPSLPCPLSFSRRFARTP